LIEPPQVKTSAALENGIQLPACSEKESEATMVSKRKVILCLCQDELTLQVRQMLLEHFGYKVLATDSVGEMKTILRRACPDMLLLDTTDPDLDCHEIANEAKSICPDILSVVLTADYGRQNARHESVDRFLRIDAPREEWLSGIRALFARQSQSGGESSGATAS
jgi:CheY-like chemotaxis protein